MLPTGPSCGENSASSALPTASPSRWVKLPHAGSSIPVSARRRPHSISPLSKPGAEFAQHVHDYSDDTILVLEGEVNFRQGDSSLVQGRRMRVCADRPDSRHRDRRHGDAVMISFQNPPDLILYTGARIRNARRRGTQGRHHAGSGEVCQLPARRTAPSRALRSAHIGLPAPIGS